MDKPEAIVFDFDGTIILDSEIIKEQAWGKVFNDKDILEQIRIAIEKFSGGKGTRFDILRFVFKETLPSDELDSFVEKKAQEYDYFVKNSILATGISFSTKKTLEEISKKYPIYINTATPVESIDDTLELLGVRECFTQVMGMPGQYGATNKKDISLKVENLLRIMANKYNPSSVVFIGDSMGDYNAANATGCVFLGISNSWNGWGHRFDLPFETYSNIVQALKSINKL